jgi:hypothetical protein
MQCTFISSSTKCSSFESYFDVGAPAQNGDIRQCELNEFVWSRAKLLFGAELFKEDSVRHLFLSISIIADNSLDRDSFFLHGEP